MRTKTDEEIAIMISKLNDDWEVPNPRVEIKTKKHLVRCTRGSEKEANNITYFEVAILKKNTSPNKAI